MSDLTDWLKKRLSPAKSNEPVWQELAGLLERFLDEFVEQHIQRLEGLRSVHTMHPDDLSRTIREMGAVFEVGLIADADKPLAVTMRRDEIHKKNTLQPIYTVLRRDFDNLEITWQPLWAPKDKVAYPYGSKFYTEREIKSRGWSFDDYYMTYRGVLEIPAGEVARLGMTRDELVGHLRRRMNALRPAHIVYDGEWFISIHRLQMQMEVGHHRVIRRNSAPISLFGGWPTGKFLQLDRARKRQLITHHFMPADGISIDDTPLDQLIEDITVQDVYEFYETDSQRIDVPEIVPAITDKTVRRHQIITLGSKSKLHKGGLVSTDSITPDSQYLDYIDTEQQTNPAEFLTVDSVSPDSFQLDSMLVL